MVRDFHFRTSAHVQRLTLFGLELCILCYCVCHGYCVILARERLNEVRIAV